MALHRASGLKTFVQCVAGPAAAPMGVVFAASRSPAPPQGVDRWQAFLRAAALASLPQLRHREVDGAAATVRAMASAGDPLAMARALLQGAGRFMLGASGAGSSARLALARGAPPGRALVFELPEAPGAAPSASASAGTLAARPHSTAAAEGGAVLAGEMGLEHTLLASAMAGRQARFISDCGAYMQSSPAIARDVFGRAPGAAAVASLVVVPLYDGDGAPMGALYLCLESPCSFEGMQEPLLGFAFCVARALQHQLKLPGCLEQLQAAAWKARRSSSSSCSCHSVASKAPSSKAASKAEITTSDRSCAGASELSNDARAPRAPRQEQRQPGGARRLNTEAMMQVLQRRVRMGWRKGNEPDILRELSVEMPLGRGGFGTVYKGRWRKNVVAVKVMRTRKNEHEAMRDAVEMAVHSAVHHPNIVKLYCHLTELVEVPAAAADAAAAGSSAGSCSEPLSSSQSCGATVGRRYRRLQSDEHVEGGAGTCSILVMEYCDRGTLRDALGHGLFHRAIGPPEGRTALAVHLPGLLEVLLDVAYALSYLHSLQLVHGDVKMENVLLASDTSRPSRFTSKIADFGLTKILSEGRRAVNLDGAGTVTHLAPEMFTAGSSVTTAVDSYAFGIFMWELYSRRRAYAGMSLDSIKDTVCNLGARPRFPPGTPTSYEALACACWHPDPACRPPASEIASCLEAISAQIQA